jgi:hypothetical protein
LRPPAPRSEAIRAKSEARVRSYLESRNDWNLSRSLKNLIEQAIRDYEHRALLELVQNAHDAQPKGERNGRILVRLDRDEGDHGVLYVANTGRPFTESNFDSICDVAQSDKRADEGIGNKGIGFKTSLQLSRVPEVYSASPAAESEPGLNGYCFRFADGEDFVALAGGSTARAAELERDIFHLCLPVPLLGIPDAVLGIGDAGYVTVIRLPLKSEAAFEEAQAELRTLESGPPCLLFLRRISSLVIEECTDSNTVRREHSRGEQPLLNSDESLSVVVVDLGEAGSFLVAERVVDPTAFKASIASSVEADRISDVWLAWEGEARVGVAVSLEEELDQGRLYTFLPMGPNAAAPLAAHINAPFFSKLARVDLEESVPLNEFLLDQVADLCAEAICLAAAGKLVLTAPTIADLLCWSSPAHVRLVRAFESRGMNLASADVIPLSWPDKAWSDLAHVHSWASESRVVLSREQLSRVAKASLVADSIAGSRLERLAQFALLIAGRTLDPSPATLADWAEALAASAARKSFKASWWESFYDELSEVVTEAATLRGRRLLLDDDLKVQRCADAGMPKQRGAAPFFSPKADEVAGNDTDADLRIPKTLKRQIFFVNQQLRWNLRSGQTTVKRPGRRFLETGLVNEYRATELFAVIARALRNKPSSARSRDSLQWIYRFTENRDAVPWAEISAVDLRVPTKTGEWIPARTALFSAAWGDDESHLLEELIARASGVSNELAELERRFVCSPDEWPFPVKDEVSFAEFLRQVGVRRGLWPEEIPRSLIDNDGRWFEDVSAITSVPMTSVSRELWRSALTQRAPQQLRPYTSYRSSAPQFRLPGQDDYAAFDDQAKRIFARLVVHGLAQWPDSMLEVTFRRYNDGSDAFTWPTPAYAFLEHGEWMPMANARERNSWYFTLPNTAWSHRGGDDTPPNFAALVPAPIRRLSERSDLAVSRLTNLGVRYWDTPETAPARIRLLADLLAADVVPDVAAAAFKKAYEDAWAVVIENDLPDPFASHPEANLIVTRKTRLALVAASSADDQIEPIYVQDADSPQVLRLLEQRGSALVRLRYDCGARLADLLREHFGPAIRQVSQSTVTVRVDGRSFAPGDAGALLVNEERAWLLDLIAGLVGLRSGRFSRPGTEAIRRTVDTARRIRIVFANQLETLVDGEPVGIQHGRGRVLALPDDYSPTIVVERQDELDERLLLERTAPAVAELIGYPDLGDTFRVTLIDLYQTSSDDSKSPTVQTIARVLGEPEERLREICDDLRQSSAQLGLVLVPILAVFSSTLASELWDTIETFANPESMASWLEGRIGDLPIVPSELIALCATDDVNVARSALGLSLRQLNAAIAELGPPFEAVTNEEGIAQAFRYFVLTHREQIRDALRTAFLATYQSAGALDAYVACRDLTDLAPNPSWIEDYYEITDATISEEVDRWLSAHGAPAFKNATRAWPPLDALRRSNRTHLAEVAANACDLVRAWEQKNEFETSSLPGKPETLVEEASALGILDFEPLTDEAVTEWFVRTGRWPTAMMRTLLPTDLGLSENEIEEAKASRDEASRERRDAGRRIKIDGKTLSAEEQDYPKIVAAIEESLSDAFLSTPPNLATLSQQIARGRKRRPTGGGTTAARRPRLTPTEAAAVGLAGETAAFRWLRKNYPDATEASWCSGYRNQLEGSGGDDRLGYDFEVPTSKGRLLFEAKATTGGAWEFDLTDAEIRAAQSVGRNERYYILFVTHVLNGDERRIYLLPNPFATEGIGRYGTLGSGLRLGFDLSSRSTVASKSPKPLRH